jgi:aminoglycoside N3'-acetyltransferase
MANQASLEQAISTAGLAGSVVCLHASVKSFGPVDGGADVIVRAFLANSVTLVVPTFTYACEVHIPPGRNYPQNGCDPAYLAETRAAVPFVRESMLISPEMGMLPARVLAHPRRIRGDHPLNSISALGPAADQLAPLQSPMDVYAPYRAALRQPSAYLILAGVELTRATPVHFGEEVAGRRLFRRWALLEDGSRVETAVGSCSEGFARLDPIVRSVETRLTVLASPWRIFPFAVFIQKVAEAIRQDPAITRCDNPECTRCRDAILGGPIF